MSKIQRNRGRERKVKRKRYLQYILYFFTFFSRFEFSPLRWSSLLSPFPLSQSNFPYPSPISQSRWISGRHLAKIQQTSGIHPADIHRTFDRQLGGHHMYTSCGYPFVPRRDFGLGFDWAIYGTGIWDVGFGTGIQVMGTEESPALSRKPRKEILRDV